MVGVVVAAEALDVDDLAVNAVRHPNIVDVLDAGVDDATAMPYLVMELLEGEDLGSRIDRLGPMRPSEALVALRQIASALDCLHARSIVHRDLKPENLMVTSDGRIKIADFGIAKATDVGAETRATDAYLDQTRSEWEALARKIWETAELGGQEKKSSAALAEVLKQKGYKTAGFISSVVLHSGRKINQGFDYYDENFKLPDQPDRLPSEEASRIAGETQNAVDKWLSENQAGNFFLWVHYYDPHDPYEPPEPYKSQFQQNPYDGEIAYTDEMVGRLLNGLKQNGLTDRTLVVLSSDHGESLGEHGEHTHGIFLYDSTLRVPLLIRLPNVRSRVIEPTVRLVDLMPTLLEAAGIDPTKAVGPLDGTSIMSVLSGAQPVERTFFWHFPNY